MNRPRPLAQRFAPAPKAGGFRQDACWVWCGSVVRGDDGQYHLFASRWPRTVPFFAGYILNSEIVRAVSPVPEGPYTFQEVVLPDRGSDYWDGRMTHNPSIHRWGDRYLLFYIGATFAGPRPEPAAYRAGRPAQCAEAYSSIRIGLATANSVFGPWQRRDTPILAPRPGHWDATVVTNPAPCVHPDGRILLLYRSNTPSGLRLGAASAPHLEAPFTRLGDGPVWRLPGQAQVEDPFIWWNGQAYEALAKDLSGELTGELHAGVHAHSPDGQHWQIAQPPLAYSRRVAWDDGSVTVQGSLERPQLLFADGQPTHLFAATGDGPGGFEQASRTWTMVIPILPD